MEKKQITSSQQMSEDALRNSISFYDVRYIINVIKIMYNMYVIYYIL